MNNNTKLVVVVLSSLVACALGGCASTGPQGARALVGFGVESASRTERAAERPSRVEAPPFKPAAHGGR